MILESGRLVDGRDPSGRWRAVILGCRPARMGRKDGAENKPSVLVGQEGDGREAGEEETGGQIDTRPAEELRATGVP